MRQPVMILLNDAIDYSPGQPTPPGAVLNTPIPQWVWITLGILAGVVVTMLVSTLLSSTPTAPVKVTPPATARAATNLLKSSLVRYDVVTFTPRAKPISASSTPTALPRQAATPQQATTFSCHLSTTAAKVGETITSTFTTSSGGTVTAMWDDKIVTGLQLQPGNTNHRLIVPNAEPGNHTLSFTFVPVGHNPINKMFIFEVMQ